MCTMETVDSRLSRIRTLALSLTAALALVMTAGCDRRCSEMADEEQTGSVSVTVLALSTADVATATLAVAGPDIVVPIKTDVVMANGQSRTTIGGIPAGSSRVFTFSARDASDLELYHGETAGITIVANQTQEISIVAQQTAAPAGFSDAVPVIDVVRVSSTNVHPGDTVTLAITAHDADQGDALTYTWAGAGTFSNPGAKSTTWTAPSAVGSFALTASVQDSKQKGVTASVQINVTGSTEPPAAVPVPGWALCFLAFLLIGAARKSIKRNSLVLAVLGGLAFTACDAEPSAESPGSGAADMTVVALTAADVASVSVTVMGPALSSPRVSSLLRTSGQWGAELGSLPVGSGYSFSATATDASGSIIYTGGASNITIVKDETVAVVITAQPTSAPDGYRNAVPVFDSLVVSSVAVGLGGQVSATVTAHDPNSADSVVHQWTATCGGFSSDHQATTTWTAPMTEGPCVLTIQASDASGATATASVTVNVDGANAKGLATVTVAANTWPVIADLSVAPDGWLVAGSLSTLSVTAFDADNDPLSIAWSCTCAGNFSAITVASPTFSLAVGVSGVCTFTVTVNDGRGGSTMGDITVPVGAPVVQEL